MTRTLAMVAALTLGLSASSACAHDVTVNVIARTVDGGRLPDVPLTVGTGKESGYALTNANGELSLSLEADPASFHCVVARLWHNFRRPGVSHLADLAALKYDEYREMYFFETVYKTEVESSATVVDVVVVAYPAVSLTVTFVVGTGPAPELLPLLVRGGVYSAMLKPGVEAVVKGVRKDAAAMLLLGVGEGQVVPVELTSSQTAENINLGEVTLQKYASEAVLRLTMSNRAGLADSVLNQLEHVAFLVRSDGQVLLGYNVASDGRIQPGFADGGVPAYDASIPAGTYYVVPGSPGGPAQRKLVSMVKSGQQAALDAASVPKVVIPQGDTVTATVDAALAYSAIMTAGKP